MLEIITREGTYGSFKDLYMDMKYLHIESMPVTIRYMFEILMEDIEITKEKAVRLSEDLSLNIALHMPGSSFAETYNNVMACLAKYEFFAA